MKQLLEPVGWGLRGASPLEQDSVLNQTCPSAKSDNKRRRTESKLSLVLETVRHQPISQPFCKQEEDFYSSPPSVPPPEAVTSATDATPTGSHWSQWVSKRVADGNLQWEDVPRADLYYAALYPQNSGRNDKIWKAQGELYRSRKAAEEATANAADLQTALTRGRTDLLTCQIALPSNTSCNLWVERGGQKRGRNSGVGNFRHLHTQLQCEVGTPDGLSDECKRVCKANGLRSQPPLLNAKPQGFITITSDGSVVSVMCFRVIRERVPRVEITRLVTVEEHQRQGYATALVAVLKELICAGLARSRPDSRCVSAVANKHELVQLTAGAVCGQEGFYLGPAVGFGFDKQPVVGATDTTPVICMVDTLLQTRYISAAMERPKAAPAPSHLPAGSCVDVHCGSGVWPAQILHVIDPSQYQVAFAHDEEEAVSRTRIMLPSTLTITAIR